jgi:hypothetical protein
MAVSTVQLGAGAFWIEIQGNRPMFAISDIAPGTQQPSSTQLQMQLIASIAHSQRVAALGAGDKSADAGARGSEGRPDSSKYLRDAVQKSALQREKQSAKTVRTEPAPADASTRSVIEAQEESRTQTALTAAFQARYAITDLLSVIRDPEDKMLPKAPMDSAA